MSTYSDPCALCSDPVLADSISRAEGCRFRGNQDSYAALETHLNPVSLPSTPETSFMGSSFDRAPCVIGDSIICTVLAVCNSLKDIGLFVHVVDEGYTGAQDLVEVTERSSDGRACVVLSISYPTADGVRAYTLYSSTSPEGVVMREDAAMGMVTSLQRASRNIVWYWSAELLGYSCVLNNCAESMWALNFTPVCVNRDTTDFKPMVPSGERKNLRVLPFFYCSAESPSMVVMGSGGASMSCGDDLAVELTALSRTIVDRAYCSTTSSGKCFCCQYICNIHSERHSRRHGSRLTLKLKLTEQFWQKTKGSKNAAN